MLIDKTRNDGVKTNLNVSLQYSHGFVHVIDLICEISTSRGTLGFSINKQKAPFGAKICQDICPQTLSVPRSEQFSDGATLSENCELRGTDNVPGQIIEHIFTPNEGQWRLLSLNLFRNAHKFENWEIFNNNWMRFL